MAQPIFPVEITEHSVEQHWAEHSTHSQVIYISLVSFIIVAIASLPFVYVDISVQSSGLIRPVAEKTEVKSPTAGKVAEVLVRDNESVKKGQPLLTIQTDLLDQQLSFNEQRVQELKAYVSDLSQLVTLTAHTTHQAPALTSTLYLQAFHEFRQKTTEIRTRVVQARKEYERALALSKEYVIAGKEVEARKLTLDMAQGELRSWVAQQRSQWQLARQQHRDELAELTTTRQRLNKEKEQYHLVAPEAGTLQNFSGIYPGSYVFANQTLAELSPDSLLIVESYVPPSDIGFLHADMPVTLQVDAFNYNEWGTATGTISSISSDVVVMNNQPVFKVRSSINQRYLTLKNGHRGMLKKGMTVHARFLVNERNLYQLLYDKVENWLNPTVE